MPGEGAGAAIRHGRERWPRSWSGSSGTSRSWPARSGDVERILRWCRHRPGARGRERAGGAVARGRGGRLRRLRLPAGPRRASAPRRPRRVAAAVGQPDPGARPDPLRAGRRRSRHALAGPQPGDGRRDRRRRAPDGHPREPRRLGPAIAPPAALPGAPGRDPGDRLQPRRRNDRHGRQRRYGTALGRGYRPAPRPAAGPSRRGDERGVQPRWPAPADGRQERPGLPLETGRTGSGALPPWSIRAPSAPRASAPTARPSSPPATTAP